jgi:hypothetical protein
MKSLEIFDPAMCCSTGVCGPTVDPALVRFAALLQQLQERGVRVQRRNLGQEPAAFAANLSVRALLQEKGAAALPAIFADGALLLQGRYPNDAEGASWLIQAGF